MEFSIVIPLYNKEKHIARAINSVLNQTHKNFELIVVDDGSTDSGVNEVKKIKDSRIRLINQSNLGVSAARNKGISVASCDFIGFLDADDAWKPDFLETVSFLIKKYPEAGAYATAYEIIRKNSRKVIPRSVLSIPKGWEGIIDDYFRFSLKSPLITASSVVIPKKVFDKVGLFREELKRGEDLEMWCRIALDYDIAFSSKVCTTYYHNTDNRACNRKAVLSESFSNYAEDILIKGRNARNYSVYFEEYAIENIISKSRYYIVENKRKEARKLLFKYSHTKYNKKALIKTYILSFIPVSVINMLRDLRYRIS